MYPNICTQDNEDYDSFHSTQSDSMYTIDDAEVEPNCLEASITLLPEEVEMKDVEVEPNCLEASITVLPEEVEMKEELILQEEEDKSDDEIEESILSIKSEDCEILPTSNADKDDASNQSLISIHSNESESWTKRGPPQGLPNNNTNCCFMLAPTHMLATTLPVTTISKKGAVNEIIYKTKKCLSGHMQKEAAHEIANKLWEFSKTKWPEYERHPGTCNQSDAAEFLLRIIQESEDVMSQVETKVETTRTCANTNCHITDQKTENVEYINRTAQLQNKPKITLQQIINSHLLHEETDICPLCSDTITETKKITKAPQFLIIQTPRVAEDETKTKQR